MMHVDVVALEVGPDLLMEGLAQRATAVHEPVDGQRTIVGQVQAVEVALLEPGQVQRRLSHRLGGDSGVRHGAAIILSLLDERNLLAEVRRLRSALLPGWARADHDQVVRGVFHIPALRCRLAPQFSATFPPKWQRESISRNRQERSQLPRASMAVARARTRHHDTSCQTRTSATSGTDGVVRSERDHSPTGRAGLAEALA